MLRSLRPAQLTADIVAAIVLLAIAAPLDFGLSLALWPGFADGLGWLGVPVALILCAALAIRRLSPPLALAAAWLGAIAQMLGGMPPLFVDIAIFGVLYATAAYGARVVMWLGLASALVGAAVITVYLLLPSLWMTGTPSTDGMLRDLSVVASLFLAAAFALVLAWTVGALVRTAHRARATRQERERAELLTAAEQERVRIARDMHDVVAHSLAVVIAQADGARYAAAADPAAAIAALGTISSTARGALADVRLLLTQLRHTQTDGPQPTLADLEALYAHVRAAGVDLRIDVDPAPPGEPPAAVQLAVYRILQEALTNALRHGAGAPVDVELAWLPDRVELSVRNRLPADAHLQTVASTRQAQHVGADEPASGHGLVGMRERAQLVGGRLEARADGVDFVVSAAIPIGTAA